jgi:hypothetical protein
VVKLPGRDSQAFQQRNGHPAPSTWVSIFLFVAIFLYGVGVGAFQWIPHTGLQTLYGSFINKVTLDQPAESQIYIPPDGQLMQFAFTRELSHPVLSEPARSLDDIRAFNESIHTPIDLFFDLPGGGIDILSAQQLEVSDVAPVIVIDFLFGGKERKAYAYGSLEDGYDASVLLIPGSGQNKGRAIVSNNHDEYHCCLYKALRDFKRFVLIKPNEGLRAVHDGVGRLSEEFIVNWHLNNGSSYSAAYTVEAIALTQFLQERSKWVALVGLSQGAKAALVTSLLVEKPLDGLVVAGGYSKIHHQLALWSGHNQFLIPGMYALTAPERIVDEIDFPTLFTYGRNEIGAYKIDADTGLTCSALKLNEQITCSVHDGGHEFAVQETLSFLKLHSGVKS